MKKMLKISHISKVDFFKHEPLKIRSATFSIKKKKKNAQLPAKTRIQNTHTYHFSRVINKRLARIHPLQPDTPTHTRIESC